MDDLKDIVCELSELAGSVGRLTNVLFDTLGSAKMGEALDALSDISFYLGRIVDMMEEGDDQE